MSENSEIGTMWENQLVMEKFSDLFDNNEKIIEETWDELWEEFLESKYNFENISSNNENIVMRVYTWCSPR